MHPRTRVSALHYPGCAFLCIHEASNGARITPQGSYGEAANPAPDCGMLTPEQAERSLSYYHRTYDKA